MPLRPQAWQTEDLSRYSATGSAGSAWRDWRLGRKGQHSSVEQEGGREAA